jgi:hypothetical protein
MRNCRGRLLAPLSIVIMEPIDIPFKRAGAPAGAPYVTLCLLLISLFAPGYLYSSGEPDAFALSGIGARAGGMGNAAIGLADGIETVYYNPAGLGNLTDSGLTAMYQAPALSTSRSFAGFNARLSRPGLPGSFGFGWIRLNSSNIEVTTADEQIVGSDSLTNDLYLMGYGARLLPDLSLGASLKYYRFAFHGFSESGLGYDIGLQGRWSVFRLGAAFTDVGGGTTLKGSSMFPNGGDVSDKVPARFRPGVAAVFPDPFGWPILVNADVDALVKLQGSQDMRLFSGLEAWTYQERVALRTGFEQAVGPTLGFGVRLGPFEIDYSFLLSLSLQDEHRISTTFRFGDFDRMSGNVHQNLTR